MLSFATMYFVYGQPAQRFDPANPRVLLHEPTFGSQEIWEALDSLLSTQVTMGAKVKRFEKEFAEHFEFSNASMVNSGSSANLLAVSALSNPARDRRLQPGDEVIVAQKVAEALTAD